MRAFEMILRVTAANLTTVLDVLKDSADLISMKQIEGEAPAPKKKRSPYANGKRNKGVSSIDLTLKAVEGGKTITTAQLENIFAANGFAKTSARPAANGLARNGGIKKLAEGVYTSV